jgi:hypothetical protein
VRDFLPDDYDGDLLDDYGDEVDSDYEEQAFTNVSSHISTKEVIQTHLRGCEAILLDE